jgi:bifunctional protein TilS/HprT
LPSGKGGATLALPEEKAFYKTVRRVVTALNSLTTLKEQFDTIARGMAMSMGTGVSLMLLDSSGKKLLRISSWRLPQFFVRKGAIDADRNLFEVTTLQPVIIADMQSDKRIRYPEIASKAGIVSMLAVPILSGSVAVGSIRVYSKERCEFTNQDISFASTMANLASLAFRLSLSHEGKENEITPLRQARSVSFANHSEEEFARILDFYNIEWVYEPRSFPLSWKGENVTEMFTPDFYMPALDLYIEITTLKQSLVTRKNRKLRRLRQLYPEVKIILLHRKEYASLLARYGCGPLAHTRARGISRVLYSADEIEAKVKELADKISKDYAGRDLVIVGVQRGFICFMADLIRYITIPLDLDFITISYYGGTDHSMFKITKDLDLNISGKHVLIVESIVDTGMTLNSILDHLRSRKIASLAVCTLLDKRIRRIVDVPLQYVGFEVQDEFLVGYGLDYREEYRNLPFVGVPELEKNI